MVILLQHYIDYDDTIRPLLLVTTSLDNMVLKKLIYVDTILKVVDVVTWVGPSLIEIQMIITQLFWGIYTITTHCIVLMFKMFSI